MDEKKVRVWVQVLSLASHYDWDHKFIINKNRYYLKPHDHSRDDAIEDLMELSIMADKGAFYLVFEFSHGRVHPDNRYMFYDRKEALVFFNQKVEEQEGYNNKGYQVIERKWNGDTMATLYTKNYKGIYEWTERSNRWVLKTCII